MAKYWKNNLATWSHWCLENLTYLVTFEFDLMREDWNAEGEHVVRHDVGELLSSGLAGRCQDFDAVLTLVDVLEKKGNISNVTQIFKFIKLLQNIWQGCHGGLTESKIHQPYRLLSLKESVFVAW